MKFHLFEVFGIELEYMIVRQKDMTVAPVADQVFLTVNNSYTGEKENGMISWSNELAAHVIELKTTDPVSQMEGLSEQFHLNILEINQLLQSQYCFLLSSACHPFMDPFSETKIWSHDNHDIYELYNRIFDCRGHGWSNVQSTHLNLPFFGEEEFARLHAAIRLLMPALPGICASSPVIDGKNSGYRDVRMHFYQSNQHDIPEITGKVIPEQIFDFENYHRRIFDPIRTSLRPFDKDHILDDLFVNSRGAIARFDRGAIEIRIMDVQECPRADLGIIEFVITVLKALVDEEFVDFEKQIKWHENQLAPILQKAIERGEDAVMTDLNYLSDFGIDPQGVIRMGEFWTRLFEKFYSRLSPNAVEVMGLILREGTLSSRILKAIGEDYSRSHLERVYRHLGICLSENNMFSTAGYGFDAEIRGNIGIDKKDTD